MSDAGRIAELTQAIEGLSRLYPSWSMCDPPLPPSPGKRPSESVPLPLRPRKILLDYLFGPRKGYLRALAAWEHECRSLVERQKSEIREWRASVSRMDDALAKRKIAYESACAPFDRRIAALKEELEVLL